MHNLRSYLAWRLLWLAIGVGLALYSVILGMDQHWAGYPLNGAGFLLLGLAWFLHPVVPDKLRYVARAVVIGPQALSKTLTSLGLGCLVFGLVLRVLHLSN